MGSTLQRQIGFTLAILISFYLTYQVIISLGFLRTTIDPEIYLNRIAIYLAGFFFCILGGWFSLRMIGAAVFASFGTAMVLFARVLSHSPFFLWFIIEYAALIYVLYRIEQLGENQMAAAEVECEKNQNLKNDLDVSYRAKGEGISILFEKYSTYYNLRKLAEKLATSISVSELIQMVVDCTMDFIPHGDIALLSLAQGEEPKLVVAAQRRAMRLGGRVHEPHTLEGDVFDYWVVKNRRRLIVTDTHQDFRFDAAEAAKERTRRSLIAAPVLNEGRVMGTLRIQSARAKNFTNDHLRLLDAISVLASSALSNAMLYEETETLAIRDSLTGLFVRRYFYDRLKEEHRRALMTHRPLSLLMCDLDHFKDCNDRYGHGAGDLMLIRFSEILTHTAENSIVCRYGGEEFSILLPEYSKEEAVKLARAIRENVEQEPFMIRRERIRMTVSVGVSNFPTDALDLEGLVVKADQALYRAKRQGRNRVCLSDT